MRAGTVKEETRNSHLMVGEGVAKRVFSSEANRLLRIAAVLAMALVLSSCGQSYRYKLTMAVNTPEGVKHGSSVGEVRFEAVSFPARGVMQKLRGEALYLDLGPGRKPLIALLTSHRPHYAWTRDAGPGTQQMSSLYDIAPSMISWRQ